MRKTIYISTADANAVDDLIAAHGLSAVDGQHVRDSYVQQRQHGRQHDGAFEVTEALVEIIDRMISVTDS